MKGLDLLAVKGLKLLIAGVLMLVGALALPIFSDFNPAPLFIAGGACALFGLIELTSGSDKRGAPVSADDMDNARNLGRHYDGGQ